METEQSKPNVDFSFIRYANCWEDPNLLLQGLEPQSHHRVLSICSAGDNSLALLSSGAEVVAVDLNDTQLACAELRKEAIKALNHDDFLMFCGINDSKTRIETYQKIRANLSKQTQQFWDSKPEIVQDGFIHGGKFENYFRLFRKRVLPLIHSRKTVSKLLAKKSESERNTFYDKKWNNWRWQLLFKLFFSRRLMGLLGRDPAFFNHVEGNVATKILERAKYALTTLNTSENPYLSYILTGNFNVLPFYLQPDNYEKIRENIDKLSLKKGAINEVALEYGKNSFDGYNLSDIFEYLDEEQCQKVYGDLLDCAGPNARFAYWNMLVPRQCPSSLSEQITPLDNQAEKLFKIDNAFFYSRFVLEEVK